MKKLLTSVLVLSMILSSAVMADRVRDDSLGNPILNIQDTAVLPRYAAALQNFPSTIFVGFDLGSFNYNYYGLGYKASDILAFCFTYDETPLASVQNFNFDGALMTTANRARVSSLIYGGKAGSLLFGAAAQTFFYQNMAPLQTITYNTNTGDAYMWDQFTGFRTTLNPSAILDLGGLNIYAQINSTLNFMEYAVIVTNASKWKTYAKPNTIENIGVSAMAFKEINDSTTLGVEVLASYADAGYTFNDITNGSPTYESTNDAYIGGTLDLSLKIGSKIKATEAVTFFVDVVTRLQQTTPLRRESEPNINYSITSIWNVPCVTLGADFEILKNLNLRIFAKPTYTVTTTQPAVIQGTTVLPVEKRVTVGAFTVNTGIGLGYSIGAFKINWELDPGFLATLLNYPLNFVDITGGASGGAPTLSSRVQVNFSF